MTRKRSARGGCPSLCPSKVCKCARSCLINTFPEGEVVWGDIGSPRKRKGLGSEVWCTSESVAFLSMQAWRGVSQPREKFQQQQKKKRQYSSNINTTYSSSPCIPPWHPASITVSPPQPSQAPSSVSLCCILQNNAHLFSTFFCCFFFFACFLSEMWKVRGTKLFTKMIVKKGQQVIKKGCIFRRQTIFIPVPMPKTAWAQSARGIVLKSHRWAFL